MEIYSSGMYKFECNTMEESVFWFIPAVQNVGGEC